MKPSRATPVRQRNPLLAPLSRVACAAIGLLLTVPGLVAAQPTTNVIAAATNVPPAAIEDQPKQEWALSVSAYTYVVPDGPDYVQPTIAADRGALHLEARYNYEDLKTGSLWVGYNLSAGDTLSVEFTPMLGGVFGNTTGVAPGGRLDVGWWKLELYSEIEYVIDANDSSGDFLYNWSELTLAPADWFRFGLVSQRTRVYDTDLDIQRGLLLAFSLKRFDFTAIVFNPDQNRPTLAFALSVSL